MCRPEGERRSVVSVGCHSTLTKGANCIGLIVHHIFLLLSPVQPAVALLQYAMEVRGDEGFMVENRYFKRSASSSIYHQKCRHGGYRMDHPRHACSSATFYKSGISPPR